MIVYVSVGDVSILAGYCARLRVQYPAPLGMLLAFYNVHGQEAEIQRLIDQGLVRHTFADSGTYTLNSGARTIPRIVRFAPYIRFLKADGHLFTWSAAFDADFNLPALNQTYYRQMRAMLAGTGLVDRIVPAVHDNLNAAAEFDLYRRLGAKRIAIGSKPRVPPEQRRLINRIRRDHGTTVHLFGNLRLPDLRQWIPESVDGAHYAHAGKYMGVLWWNRQRETLKSIPLRGPTSLRDEGWAVIEDRLGLSAADLLAKPLARQIAGMNAMHELQVYMTDYARSNRLPT